MAFISQPAQLTSVLDAVNKLLSTLGRSRVNTLTPPPNQDAVDALATLNEVDLEVQTQGWHWNREYNYPLTLNGDGTITLPNQTLSVMGAYGTMVDASDPQEDMSEDGISDDITAHGQLLYDLTAHTTVFTTAPLVDIIIRRDWDSLPQAARSYITLEACDRYQSPKTGNQVVLQTNNPAKSRAWTTLQQREDETARTNSIDGNINVVTALYGIGGLRRNRGGY
jgi:hypothetical protein